MARPKAPTTPPKDGAKKRGRPPKAAATQAAKSSEVSQEISGSKLKKLLSLGRSTTADIREISGVFGNAVAKAIDQDRLHRKAFGVVRMLDRMEPEKLAEFMDKFEYYMDASGVAARAKSAPKMDFESDSTNDADPEPEEPESRHENVRPFRQPATADAG